MAARGAVKVVPPSLVLKGGPMGNRWYTEADWAVMVEAERRMIDEGGEQRPKVLSLYRKTDKFEANPSRDKHLEGITGRVWTWTGPVEETKRRGGRR